MILQSLHDQSFFTEQHFSPMLTCFLTTNMSLFSSIIPCIHPHLPGTSLLLSYLWNKTQNLIKCNMLTLWFFFFFPFLSNRWIWLGKMCTFCLPIIYFMITKFKWTWEWCYTFLKFLTHSLRWIFHTFSSLLSYLLIPSLSCLYPSHLGSFVWLKATNKSFCLMWKEFGTMGRE